MISVLRNPTYAKLFAAQVVALVGTGLLTVALGLLAFDIAGGDAGAVMGIAMAIKMVAYVVVSPVAQAVVARRPSKPVLIGADLTRAAVAASLPFVTDAWQIYLLIFVLQSASATFTPTFQAVIPSVLQVERDYTRALSLSRLAYDLESVLSPLIAAALLTVVGFHHLFVGTVVGFLASAALVLASRLPSVAGAAQAPFVERLTRGLRAFWTAPELRGLMGLNLVVAAATAVVVVDTVVLVRGELGRPQSDVALLLGAYGGGSMLVALGVPRLLERRSDRRVMLAGGVALPVLLLAAAGVIAGPRTSMQWGLLLGLWLLLGAATSTVLTPSARLTRRNSDDETGAAVFAAQFSLSHACFLFTYPVAGVLGAAIGLAPVTTLLAGLGVVAVVFTAATWAKVPDEARSAASGARARRPRETRSR